MKILFYNLGYGRGHNGSFSDFNVKAGRFLQQGVTSQKNVLSPVLDLIKVEQPDLFTYAEISTGSFRNQYFDQHQYLVTSLQSTTANSAVSKYGNSILNRVPFHVGNSNGVISFCSDDIRPHYLSQSRKKLVYEVVINTLTVFSVHLPLISKERKVHLNELSKMVNERSGDVVVCGDFNIIEGLNELNLLTGQTSLQVAGEGVATYPAYKPKHQLDVFLYRFEDKSVTPKVKAINMVASDHLPIVLEW